MLVGGGTNKVNGTPTKKVSFVTNGGGEEKDDDGGFDYDYEAYDDDNELSVDGGGGEDSERADRLEKAKQDPNVSPSRF